MMLAPVPPRAGAPPQRRTADRRQHTRVAPARPSLCRLIAPEAAPIAAFVHNLSASGVGLFAAGPVEVGTQARLALINNAAIFCLVITVTVLRCQPTPSGEWFIAGVFDRLLVPAELGPFLA